MKKRVARPPRERTERQSAYGDYERRSQGKAKWAGLSVVDAHRANDYWLRMPAHRLFYDICRKTQLAAARLAGAAVNASFRPAAKPQLSPCYAAYPSALVAAHAAWGLTAFLEYKTHLGPNVLDSHLQAYLKDKSDAQRAGIDPTLWEKTAKHVVSTVQTRLLLEDLSRSPSLACVELYRLFSASRQTSRFDTLAEIVEAVILYGDVLFDWEQRDLHQATRAILQDLSSVSGPFHARLPREKPHGLIPLGVDWVRALCAKLMKYLPPPAPPTAAQPSAPGAQPQHTGAGQAVHTAPKEPVNPNTPVAPLDMPRPPLVEAPTEEQMAGMLLMGESGPVGSGSQGQATPDPIADFSKACAGASGQRTTFEDLRSDLVGQKIRAGSFVPGPIQGNPTEGHEVQIRLGNNGVAGGEIFDRPVELSNDFAAYERLLELSRPATEALKRELYPTVDELPVTERFRPSGTLDPTRLAHADFASAVFKRTRIHERTDRRGRPLLLIACDGSGSLSAQQMGTLKVLAAAWLNSTVKSGVQVLAALYHSGDIRDKLTGPLVQWIYHPQKTPATGRRDAARALVSLPDSGTGCQSDALSVGFLLDEARRLARGRMVYVILLTDTAWNSCLNIGKSGKDEMLELLNEAYAESDGRLHVTLVALGLSQPTTGFEQVVDKAITVSNQQLTDFAAVAKTIAVYVGSTMKERQRFVATR